MFTTKWIFTRILILLRNICDHFQSFPWQKLPVKDIKLCQTSRILNRNGYENFYGAVSIHNRWCGGRNGVRLKGLSVVWNSPLILEINYLFAQLLLFLFLLLLHERINSIKQLSPFLLPPQPPRIILNPWQFQVMVAAYCRIPGRFA